MKKLISLLLSALMVIGLLCGCRGLDTQSDAPEGAEGTSSQNTQTMETVPCHPDTLLDLIPQAVQEQMKADAITQFGPEGEPEVRFEVYGVFGDVYVLFVEYGSGVLDMVCSETVDGIEVWYGSSMTMRVYYDGHYYKLQEAFDAQIIDHFKLECAVENYYYFYPFMDPDREYSDTLSDELRAEIEAYYGRPLDTNSGLLFLGTYNGYTIIKRWGNLAVITEIEIDGYYFYEGSNMTVEGYRDGTTTELQSLYESGAIIKEDLHKIWYQYQKQNITTGLEELYDQPICWYTSYEEYLKDPQGQPAVYFGEVEGWHVFAVYSPEKPVEEGLTIGSYSFDSPVKCEIFIFSTNCGGRLLREAFYLQEVTDEFIGKVHAIWSVL